MMDPLQLFAQFRVLAGPNDRFYARVAWRLGWCSRDLWAAARGDFALVALQLLGIHYDCARGDCKFEICFNTLHEKSPTSVKLTPATLIGKIGTGYCKSLVADALSVLRPAIRYGSFWWVIYRGTPIQKRFLVQFLRKEIRRRDRTGEDSSVARVLVARFRLDDAQPTHPMTIANRVRRLARECERAPFITAGFAHSTMMAVTNSPTSKHSQRLLANTRRLLRAFGPFLPSDDFAKLGRMIDKR